MGSGLHLHTFNTISGSQCAIGDLTLEFWMIALPLISVWCFLLDGVFVVATRGAEMRSSMLICTFIFFLPLWYVFQFMGNHGLWLAFTTFIAVRGVVLGIYNYRIERNEGFVNVTQ